MKHILNKIIDRNLYYLVHLKKIFTHNFHKKYFSQSGEDVILSEIFKDRKNGYYVDVGSFHPIHYSNTYLLYKNGWHGINIDPNPKSIKLFNIYRKRDVNIQAGVSKHEKEMKYYIFNHESCNTFSEDQKEEMKKKSYIRLTKTETIKCIPLRKILCEYAKTEIDLMSIDTEGFDLDVLESNDWEKFRPAVIVVEKTDFDFNNMNNDPIYSFLKDRNYSLYAKTGLSLIFKSNEK